MRGAPRLWISAVLLCGCGLAASGPAASAQNGSTFTVTVPPPGKQGKGKQLRNLSVPNNAQAPPPGWNGAPANNAPAPYNAAPNNTQPYGAQPVYGAQQGYSAPTAYGTAPAYGAPSQAPPASTAAGPNSARFLANYGSGGAGAPAPAANTQAPPPAAAGYAAAPAARPPAAAATSGYAAAPAASAGYAVPAANSPSGYPLSAADAKLIAAAAAASSTTSPAAAAGSAYGSPAATSGYAAAPSAGAGYTAAPAATATQAASNAYAAPAASSAYAAPAASNAYTAPPASAAYAPAPTTSAYAAPPTSGYITPSATNNAAPATGGTYATTPSGGSTFTATTAPGGGSQKRGKHSKDIPVPAANTVVAGNAPAYTAPVHGSMVAPTSAGAPAALTPAEYDTTTPTPPSFDARTLLKPKVKPKEAPHVLVHSTTQLPDGIEPNPPDEDAIVADKLSWRGEYELDRNEQVLLDAEGKPVPVLYTAKGRAVRPKNVRLSGRHPATILNGVLTVDGFPAKGHLNYAVQDMKFLYFSAPGIGTVVISPAPFDGGEEQKDAFSGQTLSVKVDEHDFSLATERPILGKENAPAWVKLDKDYVADNKNPVMGYGMHDEAPYMWPGAIRGKAVQGSLDAPAIPVNMRPKMNAAPCPADRICPE